LLALQDEVFPAWMRLLGRCFIDPRGEGRKVILDTARTLLRDLPGLPQERDETTLLLLRGLSTATGPEDRWARTCQRVIEKDYWPDGIGDSIVPSGLCLHGRDLCEALVRFIAWAEHFCVKLPKYNAAIEVMASWAPVLPAQDVPEVATAARTPSNQQAAQAEEIPALEGPDPEQCPTCLSEIRLVQECPHCIVHKPTKTQQEKVIAYCQERRRLKRPPTAAQMERATGIAARTWRDFLSRIQPTIEALNLLSPERQAFVLNR
jgi:hypothetical protein